MLLTGALALTAVILLNREREPTYAGKSLTEWIAIHADEFDHMQPDFNKLLASKKAIRQIGTNALPFLLNWVSFESPKNGLKKNLSELVGRLPNEIRPRFLRRWAESDLNEERAANSIWAFFLFRDEARLCIPRLVELMNDTNSPGPSRNAAFALGWLGPDAMPIFSKAIADTNTPFCIRMNIAIAAGMYPELGGCSAQSVAVLAQCAQDPDLRVRETAIRALGRIGGQSRAYSGIAVAALTNCFRADFPITTQYLAMRSLTYYGNEARVAVPILIALLESPDPYFRPSVTNALRFIAPEVITNALAK